MLGLSQEHIGGTWVLWRPCFANEAAFDGSLGRLSSMVQGEQGVSWTRAIHTWTSHLSLHMLWFNPLSKKNTFLKIPEQMHFFASLLFVNKVFKRRHGAYMTAKAWNGRVIAQWLSDCSDAVYSNNYPPADSQRILGRWIRNTGIVVNDERLLHQKLAMYPGTALDLNLYMYWRASFSASRTALPTKSSRSLNMEILQSECVCRMHLILYWYLRNSNFSCFNFVNVFCPSDAT